MKLSRRKLMERGIKTGAALPLAAAGTVSLASLLSSKSVPAASFAKSDSALKFKIEVAFYDKLEHKMIRCKTCPKECRVGDNERGFCGNKENHGGKYYTLAYGNPCSMNVDPIEKKPFFHFLPGTLAFSLATAGCNFDCKFCQNWEISQARPEQTRNIELPPGDVAAYAAKSGSRSVAYTYGEPVVFYEYMSDCAKAARKQGIRNVMISNGYIQKEPMRNLCKVLDAVKIDYKAHSDDFYEKVCLGKLKHVQDTVVLLKESGIWIELVYLMVPTLNGEPDEIKKMADWILKKIGPDVPLHFSRFHPIYKLNNLEPTPLNKLEQAHKICVSRGLHYVYIGNVPGHPAESTYCPKCGKVAIQRYGYVIQKNNLKNGKCGNCGESIPGIWS